MTHRAKRLAFTLGHVDFDALLNTLAHALSELQVKKPADKLCDVKVLALVDMLAYILEKEICCESRRDVEVKALIKTLAYKLAEVKAKKVRTHYAMCMHGHCTTNLLPRLQR